MTWFAILLVIVGNVVYHLGQRAIPREANPVVATLAAYLVATTVTLLTIPLLATDGAIRTGWRALNWSTAAVGAGIVAIELGFLLAYRAGWRLSTASITANATVALVLVGIGAIAYRETLTAGRLAGIGLCVAGLWLVARP
jgi:drug/metabolite transporter (DMT)-like permease